MSDQLCRLWTYIEKKAFIPEDLQKWLACFHQFLPVLWQNDDYKFRPLFKGSCFCSDNIEHGCLTLESCCKPEWAKIGFYYSIQKNLGKFDLQIFWHDVSIQLGYDSKFLYEYISHDYNKIFNKDITISNIKDLLHRRIKHPALHQHLKDKNEFPHNVRLGLACNNPCVILYQVALQILWTLDEKIGEKLIDEELERLTQVIVTYRSNTYRLPISPGVLFSIK